MHILDFIVGIAPHQLDDRRLTASANPFGTFVFTDISYDPIDFPSPILYQAIEAADKKQEDKVFAGLARLREEDPSFVIERNSETRQTLLGGQGEQQLNIIKDKLKDRFGVEVVTIPQKIAYRETIRGTSDVQGKHKKQTGGAGQYGDVHIKFSPSEEEFEFEENSSADQFRRTTYRLSKRDSLNAWKEVLSQAVRYRTSRRTSTMVPTTM